MTDEYPLPDVDPINRPFWENATDGRFVLQRCADCEECTFPPRVACPRCFGELEWEAVPGSGTLYTFGVVHRPSHPMVFENETPFVLGVAALDVGPRVAGHVVGCAPDTIEIGMPLEVVFEEVAEGISLPMLEAQTE